MAAAPAGAMLAVRTSEEEVRRRLSGGLCIAACNSPTVTVVSGLTEEIDEFKRRLDVEEVAASVLVTSHAFHSSMMSEAAEAFRGACGECQLSAPALDIFPTVSSRGPGDWSAPGYWSEQICAPVHFAEAVTAAGAPEARIFVDIGPGAALSAMIGQTLTGAAARPTAALGCTPAEDAASGHALLCGVGRLWTYGVQPLWRELHAAERRRVPLPTYPFERRRHWVDAVSTGARPAAERRERTATVDDEVGEVIEKQLQIIAGQLALLRDNG